MRPWTITVSGRSCRTQCERHALSDNAAETTDVYSPHRQLRATSYGRVALRLEAVNASDVTLNHRVGHWSSTIVYGVTVFDLISEHTLISEHPPILCWWRLLPEHIEIYVYWLCSCVASCNRYLMLINHPTDGATRGLTLRARLLGHNKKKKKKNLKKIFIYFFPPQICF